MCHNQSISTTTICEETISRASRCLPAVFFSLLRHFFFSSNANCLALGRARITHARDHARADKENTRESYVGRKSDNDRAVNSLRECLFFYVSRNLGIADRNAGKLHVQSVGNCSSSPPDFIKATPMKKDTRHKRSSVRNLSKSARIISYVEYTRLIFGEDFLS